MSRPAVFLDRDGVIVREGDGLGERALEILPGVAAAIGAVRAAGYLVIVVTNQPVVARGTMTEDEVRETHARLGATLAEGGGAIDAFYFCPHHPSATLEAYRVACGCRKPRPGMLLTAAREWAIDLAASVMIGDRLSDVAAGQRAGCRTILVESGMHLAAPIESPDAFAGAVPDLTAADLPAAVRAFLGAGGVRGTR
jgi:D-glycero-D-manno-heptose 1,7-bisphosphate phosphatase